MLLSAEDIVKKLDLIPHPEGGFYRETYRSMEEIPGDHLPERFDGDRSIATSIYYLLKENDFSAFHCIKSEETWHHYLGKPIHLYIIDSEGNMLDRILGKDLISGQEPQITISAGNWFSAHVEGKEGYALVGCTVAPGFDFADFEMGNKTKLCHQFPEHQNIITAFCRD